MPDLPLDAPEPFAATLGVMLYPGTDDGDPRKAQGFASVWLAEPLKRIRGAGHQLSYDALARIAEQAGSRLDDLDQRWRGGLAMGDLFKALFALAWSHAEFASWENAIKIYKKCAFCHKLPASRALLHGYIRRFRPVAHLWGALSIREGCFQEVPSAGYGGHEDFQSFLQESEILRDFGVTWHPTRRGARSPLTGELWRVPAHWRPLTRQEGWPKTGAIPQLRLPDEFLSWLRPPGRPKKQP